MGRVCKLRGKTVVVKGANYADTIKIKDAFAKANPLV